MTTAYQCPTCGDVTEDGACLCGPPVPTVARVPLRPALRSFFIREHRAAAERHRLAAAAQRERAASEADPEWAALLRTGATRIDEMAAASEARADRWAS